MMLFRFKFFYSKNEKLYENVMNFKTIVSKEIFEDGFRNVFKLFSIKIHHCSISKYKNTIDDTMELCIKYGNIVF